MVIHTTPRYLDLEELHKIDKAVAYAVGYGSTKPLQLRIDEEGCGAVFAAITEIADSEKGTRYESK